MEEIVGNRIVLYALRDIEPVKRFECKSDV